MKRRLLAWLIIATIMLLVLVFNFSLISTIATSLKRDVDISSFPPKWVFPPTSQHYRNVLYGAGYEFPAFFRNSVMISLGAALMVVAICLPAAYSMVRFGTGGKRLFSFLVSLRLLPPIIFAIPIFILYQRLGLVDTRLGLILINGMANVPLALLIFASFIRDLPQEVEEAARIDGCSTLGVMRYAVMPMMLPAIAATAILTYIFTWNDFLFSLILSIRQSTTVTVGASLFVTAWGIRWGDIAAAISLSILPPLVFTFLVQRYIVRGLAMGSVKG